MACPGPSRRPPPALSSPDRPSSGCGRTSVPAARVRPSQGVQERADAARALQLGVGACDPSVRTAAGGSDTPVGLRPRRPPERLQPQLCRRGAGRDVRRSPSSTRTTTRTPRPTSRLPHAVRAAACTTANGCFTKVNQNGADDRCPPPNSGWADGDLARPRHGLGGLPELQDPARRGDHASIANLGDRGEHGRHARRDARLEQLRRRASPRRDTSTTVVLQPPRRRHHRELRRLAATASQLPGRLASTSRRSAAPSLSSDVERARLDRALGTRTARRAPAAAARRTSPSRPGRTTPAAPSAPSPTSRPWPTRHRASRSTTATATPRLARLRRHQRVGADRRRLLRARRQHRRHATPAASTRTPTPARFNDVTSRQQRQLLGRSTCAPAAPGYDGPTGLGTPNGGAIFGLPGREHRRGDRGHRQLRHPRRHGEPPWRGGDLPLRVRDEPVLRLLDHERVGGLWEQCRACLRRPHRPRAGDDLPLPAGRLQRRRRGQRRRRSQLQDQRAAGGHHRSRELDHRDRRDGGRDRQSARAGDDGPRRVRDDHELRHEHVVFLGWIRKLDGQPVGRGRRPEPGDGVPLPHRRHERHGHGRRRRCDIHDGVRAAQRHDRQRKLGHDERRDDRRHGEPGRGRDDLPLRVRHEHRLRNVDGGQFRGLGDERGPRLGRPDRPDPGDDLLLPAGRHEHGRHRATDPPRRSRRPRSSRRRRAPRLDHLPTAQRWPGPSTRVAWRPATTSSTARAPATARRRRTVDAGAGSSPVDASAALANLNPAEQYHYRLVATNSTGTIHGDDRTFTTALPPPLAATGAATNVTGLRGERVGHLRRAGARHPLPLRVRADHVLREQHTGHRRRRARELHVGTGGLVRPGAEHPLPLPARGDECERHDERRRCRLHHPGAAAHGLQSARRSSSRRPPRR